jgi:hypothetical protein
MKMSAPPSARDARGPFGSPNTFGVLQTPLIQSLLLIRREAFFGVCHTLEYIVVVFWLTAYLQTTPCGLVAP